MADDSASSPSFSSFRSFVTLKLDGDNYLSWKTQILPYLRGHDLYHHIDGTSETPPTRIDNKPNPLYDKWLTKDQLVMTILTSSLSDGVLAQVTECLTALQIWKQLKETYASRSCATAMQTRIQLSSLKKGGDSISVFFNKAKSLASILSAVGQTVTDPELRIMNHK